MRQNKERQGYEKEEEEEEEEDGGELINRLHRGAAEYQLHWRLIIIMTQGEGLGIDETLSLEISFCDG